jgi:hypothetical protein
MLRQAANLEPIRERITSNFGPINSSEKIVFRIAMLSLSLYIYRQEVGEFSTITAVKITKLEKTQTFLMTSCLAPNALSP